MEKTKLIAIYFPQFHSIPENNRWWGHDFTDWELVRGAKPLYGGHHQPRIPLEEDYYNPCEKQTLEKQIRQAKEYGIHGFMFYHYWFDGRLILEKPLETFLDNKDLEMPFCLSWANNSWTRQWKANNEFLLEQKHIPDPVLWEKHFNYLLPFFKDQRAIRIGNKPVFVINSPELIKKQKEMFSLWDKLAKENGLDGIYLIASKHFDFAESEFLSDYDALMKIHPREANTSNKNPKGHKVVRMKWFRHLPERFQNTLRQLRLKCKSKTIISSEQIWNYILSNAYVNDYPQHRLDIFEAVYFDWDNTARYGKRATIFTALPMEKRQQYMQKLIGKTQQAACPYIFFNAWNEWSEGTYLEPDKKYGYANLELIKKLFG